MKSYQLAGIDIPGGAITWNFTHASGPGGQHVNKANSAVELRLSVSKLKIDQYTRSRLLALAGSHRTKDDEILIVAQNERSQWRNRASALNRLESLLHKSKIQPKPRVRTKPTRASIRRRLNDKKRRGELKVSRRALNLAYES